MNTVMLRVSNHHGQQSLFHRFLCRLFCTLRLQNKYLCIHKRDYVQLQAKLCQSMKMSNIFKMICKYTLITSYSDNVLIHGLAMPDYLRLLPSLQRLREQKNVIM